MIKNAIRQARGMTVPHRKNTAGKDTEIMKPPAYVTISMAQHIGAPCRPVVNKGDKVYVGQTIGDSDAPVSAPVHSSVSGTVEEIKQIRSSMGGRDTMVVIKSDRKQTPDPNLKPPTANNFQEFISALRNSGIVGMGGASFPTHVKLNPKEIDKIDSFIVNGAECEPYITADHRAMLEETEDLVAGIKLVMENLNIEKGYVAIESNKPDAIVKVDKALTEAGLTNVDVVSLKPNYPKGAERILIYEILGKNLPAGALTYQAGTIVNNVTTVTELGRYFRTGMPLVQRRVTVEGPAVRNPQNIMVPIGTQISDVIKACGGYRKVPKKIVMGGPMMGKSIIEEDLPILKNNNAILVFDEKGAELPSETACINCGSCYRACPIDLIPFALVKAYKRHDIPKLKKLDVMQCMECGSCAYVCPARIPIGFCNKVGKQLVKEAEQR